MLSYLILFVTVLVIRARPLDSNQTRSGGGDSPRRAPEFLLQMQSCMNIKGREMRRACLNFTEKDQDLVERITNAVWGSVGNGKQLVNGSVSVTIALMLCRIIGE